MNNQLLNDIDSKLDIYQIISLLPTTPYHDIAHVFFSSGELSIQLGKIVYRGQVKALDPVKKNLTLIRKELKKIRLTNVKALHILDEANLKLKDSSIDGAVISFAIRNSSNITSILNESNRFINKGGWLSLIDENPSNNNSISCNTYKQIAEKSGFHFHSKHNLSDTIYMMLFRK